jgi:phosphoglycolate phosphatase-like HAD superfamily hydrolase
MTTLVLFDIDGTLLLGAGSGRAATERAMHEVFGTVGALAEYRFAGKTDWYTLVELLTPEGFTETHIEQTLPHYSEVLVRHMKDVISSYPVKALPGALDLVQALALRSDVILGILTGNVPQMADLKLRTVGFDPSVFSINVYGTEARIRRELAPIALARAELHTGQIFAPSDVVIIGDTLDDIDCAHSIGARVIAVTTGFTERATLEKDQPVTVLDNLADTEVVLSLIVGEQQIST